ncbi:hypothetical protein [Hyphomicrobium sp. CS1GBMeth3]|uniref:hypothetical protein n=1 Tax=Hyphomicrobium sp. CS1GBMeth3 TaxID=1892845 RepID=UPI000931876C|nr:hypothetical protein [Hyphomicrobium sp. CS1GBMeth3]
MSATDTIEREAADVALVPVPQGRDAYTLFTATDTTEADRIVGMVRTIVEAFADGMPDISTAAGRKEVKSFAYKITRSKTLLDGEGKKIVDELKDLPKRVDANRRHIRDALDAIKDALLKPVTEWEAAEEERVNRIKDALAELQGTIEDPHWPTRTAEAMRDRLREIEADFADVSEARFGEYAPAAAELKFNAVASLATRISTAEKREAEAAELERLRAEAAERERKDREAKIAEEAAAKAKADAQREASEREARLIREAEEAKRAKEAAEKHAVEAARRAREDAEAEAARRQEAEAAEQRRREQDRTRRATVHRAALEALTAACISEEIGKQVITLIAQGQVPAIRITY